MPAEGDDGPDVKAVAFGVMPKGVDRMGLSLLLGLALLLELALLPPPRLVNLAAELTSVVRTELLVVVFVVEATKLADWELLVGSSVVVVVVSLVVVVNEVVNVVSDVVVLVVVVEEEEEVVVVDEVVVVEEVVVVLVKFFQFGDTISPCSCLGAHAL